MEALQKYRRERLAEAAKKAGSNTALGKLLGYFDGAYIGQMLRGDRPITEDTVFKLEAKTGFRGWFTLMGESAGYAPTGSEDEPVKSAADLTPGGVELTYSGRPQYLGVAPVNGIARVNEEGFFQAEHFQARQGGWVPSFSANPGTYALLVKGDGLAPVYESGQYLLIEPGAAVHPGERVLLTFKDGRQAIRRLLFQRPDEVSVTSVTKVEPQTIEVRDIAAMDPIFGVIEASRWMAELPGVKRGDEAATGQHDASELPPAAAPRPSRYVKSQNMGAAARAKPVSKKRSA